MQKRYVVRLTNEERGSLEALVRRGRAHARKLLYARILLKADASTEGGPALTDERIADAWRPAPPPLPASASASRRRVWRSH
jgi:hypothetical protein